MRSYIERSMTYTEYLGVIDSLLLEGKTTGPNQSADMFGYAKLNRQRIGRLEKTVVLRDSTKNTVRSSTRPMIWLTITEGWCGDAAQNIPVIEKIAAENANIETRYILRDENLELIDRYLTNGARAIPKLIALDAETLEVLFTWGARPQAAQDYFLEQKALGAEKAVIMEGLQRWYNSDKGESVQDDFEALLKGISVSAETASATV